MLLTGALVAVSSQGLLYAGAAIVAAAYLVVLLTVGARTTGILCFMGAFATAPMYRGIEQMTGGAPPTDVFVVAGIIHLAPTLIGTRLKLPIMYVLGLLLMAICSLISVMITGNLLVNAFYAGQWIFYVGALPLAIALWRPHYKIVDRLCWAYLAGHLLSTAKGFVEGSVNHGRYDGLTHHPNAFGIAGVTSIALVFYLFAHHTDVRTRVVLAAFAATSLASITMSGSRAALVVLVVIVLLVPLVERSALMGIGLAVVAALGIISLPLIVDVSGEGSAVSRLAGDGTAKFSDNVREGALSVGFDRFWHSPVLGSGFEGVEQFHNVYLEAAIATGIIGLLAYAAVLYPLARPLFTKHPMRRLTYVVWVFMGIAPTFPGLWDRTMWVPASLAALAMIKPDLLQTPRSDRAKETDEPEQSLVVAPQHAD
ncbi:O-antigen ligase family protein [Nocardioides humilatus]|uniref:O-antigen ligase family protein n=1 Tax=Nocardioides humilatus TaxID=2607660 RepID=A0A5B1LPJ8_9ACTN|nr:O-antigen ligase family protein [Nocardioides humilatus]KAA1421487.1 O-antigen ligase family protein [Nocardioides humilatus]